MGDYYILYLLGTLAVMIGSFVVQSNLKSKAAKGSQIRAASGKTANQVVEEMLREHGITGITIDHKPGELTDCYSPREGKIYLSDTTYNQCSITAIAVAAHECGHAVQDHENMPIYRLRQMLAPVAGISSQAGVWLAMIGLIVAQASSGGSELAYNICTLGIIIYMAAFLFYLVMLPVERNASNRAYKDMKQAGWVGQDQLKFSYKVLRAAGDTYAIALASAAVTLLRLLAIRGNSGRRR
ncbi:MAG: zinc metallopeptidase [Saccharofermentans sp.]|nr:zinc metallopeptidase [Saccharofermentans sp.]